MTFSFTDVSFSAGKCRVDVSRVNGVDFRVDKEAFWDVDKRGFYYQLFIELWIYNVELQALELHNRFVGLWLNMTG